MSLILTKLKNLQCVELFYLGRQRTLLNKNVKILLNLKAVRNEKLFINTFYEKSSFLKEFDTAKIKIKAWF